MLPAIFDNKQLCLHLSETHTFMNINLKQMNKLIIDNSKSY